jgi:molybdopterin synthase catalytic subunit
MAMRTHYQITDVPLDLKRLVAQVSDPSAGAVATFTGTTRNSFQGKAVRHLEYEAYPPMAERTLAEIGTEIASRWPETVGLAIEHRVGRLEVGEASVVVVVAAPHRREALAACGYAIDRLKQTLPVWKKEVFADGTIWRENVIEGGELD